MTNLQTIQTPQDYVNYTFNIQARGVAEVSGELMGLSNTVTNILGQIAFKTSEFLSHTEMLAIGAGAAISATFFKATQDAIHFEQQIANVKAIGGEGIDANIIGAKAMEYSNKFGMATASMTEGLEALARAGITTTNVMAGVLEEGVKLSKLEGLDLEESINDLISTTNLLSTMDVDMNAPEYAEQLKAMNQHIVSTSESAPINAQNIIQTLQHVGGYASAGGIDQDDLFAVIAQLGSRGTKGEMAGTALRAFIAAGQKDTAQRALARIGLDVTDLWNENGESMLSISEMKDVLDNALEARGYSKQEKLEFYSDFAGYKQANQIMKINTSEVGQYKEQIANAWDLGKKLDTILGTVRGNLDRIWQISQNFMTKVGGKMLKIANVILTPVRMALELFTKIPFADTGTAFLMMFVGLRTGLALFTKLIPALGGFISRSRDGKEYAKGIRGEWEKTTDQIKLSKEILENLKDPHELTKIHYREQGLSAKNKAIIEDEVIGQMYMDSEMYRTTGIAWDQASPAFRDIVGAEFKQTDEFDKNYREYVKRTREEAAKAAESPIIIKDFEGTDNLEAINTYVQYIFNLLAGRRTRGAEDRTNSENDNSSPGNRERNRRARDFRIIGESILRNRQQYGNYNWKSSVDEMWDPVASTDIEELSRLQDKINRQIEQKIRDYNEFSSRNLNATGTARVHKSLTRTAMSPFGIAFSTYANTSDIRHYLETGERRSSTGQLFTEEQLIKAAEAMGISFGTNDVPTAEVIYNAYQARRGQDSELLDKISNATQQVWFEKQKNRTDVSYFPTQALEHHQDVAEKLMDLVGASSIAGVQSYFSSNNYDENILNEATKIMADNHAFMDEIVRAEITYMYENLARVQNTIEDIQNQQNSGFSSAGESISIPALRNTSSTALNKEILTKNNIGTKLQDLFLNGSIITSTTGYGQGTLGFADRGIIDIRPGVIRYYTDQDSDTWGEYGNTLLDTVIHEMTHTLMMHDERQKYKNNNIPSELGIDNFKTSKNIAGYNKNFVAEYEAQYVTSQVFERLGLEFSSKNQERMAEFHKVIKQAGYEDQIQYEILDQLVDNMLDNITVIGDITKSLSTQFNMAEAGVTSAQISEDMRPILTKIQAFDKDRALYQGLNFNTLEGVNIRQFLEHAAPVFANKGDIEAIWANAAYGGDLSTLNKIKQYQLRDPLIRKIAPIFMGTWGDKRFNSHINQYLRREESYAGLDLFEDYLNPEMEDILTKYNIDTIASLSTILSKTLLKTQGLPFDVRLYRRGGLNTADNGFGVLTGVTSTAYELDSTKGYGNGYGNDLIEILAPARTQGLNLYDWEYTLAPNTPYVELGQYGDATRILLLPPKQQQKYGFYPEGLDDSFRLGIAGAIANNYGIDEDIEYFVDGVYFEDYLYDNDNIARGFGTNGLYYYYNRDNDTILTSEYLFDLAEEIDEDFISARNAILGNFNNLGTLSHEMSQDIISNFVASRLGPQETTSSFQSAGEDIITAASKEQQLIYDSLLAFKYIPGNSGKTVMPFDDLKDFIINQSDKETAESAIKWIKDNYGPNGKIGKMLGTSKNGVYISRMRKIIEANSDLSKVVSGYISVPVTTADGEKITIELPLHSAEPHYRKNDNGEYILDEEGNKILDQAYMNKFIHSATKIDMTKKGKKIKIPITHEGISEILDSDTFRKLPIQEQAKVYDAILEHEGHTLFDVLAPDDKIKKAMKPNRLFGVLNTGTTGLSCPNRGECGTCEFKQYCYAARDAQRLPNVSKNQMQKALYFTTHSVDEIVQDIAKRNLSVVRINQEGDIQTLDDFKKIIDIVNELPEVKFYGYTKNLEVLDQIYDEEGKVKEWLPKNLHINNSLGTSKEGNYVAASFYMLADYIEKGYRLCLGACAECEKCVGRLNKVTLLRDGTISKIFGVEDLKDFNDKGQVAVLRKLYAEEAKGKTLNEELVQSTIKEMSQIPEFLRNTHQSKLTDFESESGFASKGGFESKGSQMPAMFYSEDSAYGRLWDASIYFKGIKNKRVVDKETFFKLIEDAMGSDAAKYAEMVLEDEYADAINKKGKININTLHKALASTKRGFGETPITEGSFLTAQQILDSGLIHNFYDTATMYWQYLPGVKKRYANPTQFLAGIVNGEVDGIDMDTPLFMFPKDYTMEKLKEQTAIQSDDYKFASLFGIYIRDFETQQKLYEKLYGRKLPQKIWSAIDFYRTDSATLASDRVLVSPKDVFALMNEYPHIADDVEKFLEPYLNIRKGEKATKEFFEEKGLLNTNIIPLPKAYAFYLGKPSHHFVEHGDWLNSIYQDALGPKFIPTLKDAIEIWNLLGPQSVLGDFSYLYEDYMAPTIANSFMRMMLALAYGNIDVETDPGNLGSFLRGRGIELDKTLSNRRGADKTLDTLIHESSHMGLQQAYRENLDKNNPMYLPNIVPTSGYLSGYTHHIGHEFESNWIAYSVYKKLGLKPPSSTEKRVKLFYDEISKQGKTGFLQWELYDEWIDTLVGNIDKFIDIGRAFDLKHGEFDKNLDEGFINMIWDDVQAMVNNGRAMPGVMPSAAQGFSQSNTTSASKEKRDKQTAQNIQYLLNALVINRAQRGTIQKLLMQGDNELIVKEIKRSNAQISNKDAKTVADYLIENPHELDKIRNDKFITFQTEEDLATGRNPHIPIPNEEPTLHKSLYDSHFMGEEGQEARDRVVGAFAAARMFAHADVLESMINTSSVWKKTAKEIDNVTSYLGFFTGALERLGEVVTPLQIIITPLVDMIEKIRGVSQLANDIGYVTRVIKMLHNPSGMTLEEAKRFGLENEYKDASIIKSILGNSPAAQELYRTLDDVTEVFTKYFDKGKEFVIKKAILPLINFIISNITIIAPIVAGIAATVAGLWYMEKQHAKALQETQEEIEELNSTTLANLATYKDLHKQREGETDALKRQQLARREAIALYELEVNGLKKLNAINKESQLKSDTLWGEYGMRAGWQRFTHGHNLMSGEFQSLYENYDGTTKNIRQIREEVVGNLFATSAQREVAAYYDANILAFGEIEAFSKELNELYDKESKLIEQYGSIEAARETEEFNKAVQEFSDATRLNGETAVKYLDWLETENKVDKATQAMQVEVDMIVAEARRNMFAALYPDRDFNSATGIRDAMIYAQADQMIKDAYDQLWWDAFGNTLWGYFDLILYTLNPVDWVGELLGWEDTHAKMAEKHFNAAKAADEGQKALIENTDNIIKIGEEAADKADRRNYGTKSSSNYGDTPFGFSVENALEMEYDSMNGHIHSMNDLMYYGMINVGKSGVSGFKDGLNQHSPGDISQSVADEMAYTIDVFEANKEPIGLMSYEVGYESGHQYGEGFKDGLKDLYAQISTPEALSDTLKEKILYNQGLKTAPNGQSVPNDETKETTIESAVDVGSFVLPKVLGQLGEALFKKLIKKGVSKGLEELGEATGKAGLKTAGKTFAKVAPYIGPAVTATNAIIEHNPYEKHYNEDGSEKRAFQATGEVVGETAGALAAMGLGLAVEGILTGATFGLGAVPAAIIGAGVEMVAGMILEPIGEAIGGTIGWMVDEIVNTPIKDIWGGFNDALGGIPGQIYDFIDQSPIGQAGHFVFDKLDQATGGWLSGAWDYVSNSSLAGMVGDAWNWISGAATNTWNWLFGGEEEPAYSSYDMSQAGKVSYDKAKRAMNKKPQQISTDNSKSTIIIKNININTEDDPEKIKTAFMNLMIELEEQISPRQVSRVVGMPATQSTETSTEDTVVDPNAPTDTTNEDGTNTTTNTTNNNPTV